MPHPVDYLLDYEGGFFGIRHAVEHTDFLAGIAFGVALLGDTPLVVGDDAVGRIDDGAGRAVVALEADYLAVGVVFAEIEDVLDLGSAEGIDRLRVVSDHADIAAYRCEFLEDDVLREVGVLVLVDHDVVEAGGKDVESLRVVAKKDIHVNENIVEVHHARRLEFLLVEFVKVGHPGALSLAVGGEEIFA